MKTAIIIGGGFSGCTMAFFLKNKGFNVKIFESSSVLGAGLRTNKYKGHPYTFGPRHLLINKNDTEAIKYFKNFFELRELTHKVLTMPYGEDTFYNYPPTKEDIDKLAYKDAIYKEIKVRDLNFKPRNLKDYWQSSVGNTLYSMFVDNYSKKMWDIKNNEELDQDLCFSVQKEPIRQKAGDFFSGEIYVAYPKPLDGYNSYFDKCVQGCEVYFNTKVNRVDIDKKIIHTQDNSYSADIIISTISLDDLFDYCYGELKYMGRDFIKIVLPAEHITPEGYYFLYYAGDEPYTRIVEYKTLTGYKSKDTLIGIEIPSHNNRLYPYPTKAEVDRANRYKELLPKGVYSIGRLGEYKYKDMYWILKDIQQLIKEL